MSDSPEGKRCPQCGYGRKAREPVPDDVCPQCGVVYWKVEQGAGDTAVMPRQEPAPEKQSQVSQQLPPEPVIATGPVRLPPRGAAQAMRSPLVLGLVGVVGLIVLLKGGCAVRGCLAERDRQRWMPLVKSLDMAVHQGRADYLNFGRRGEMVRPSGPVLVWSREDNRPDTFGAEGLNLAAAPEETVAVIFVDKRWEQVGSYTDGAPALQDFADVYVVDVASKRCLHMAPLRGEKPPEQKKGGVMASGLRVDGKLKAWLEENLR